MAETGPPPGAARLTLVDGATLLHPEESVFAAMLEGWARQQQSRLLRASTIRNRTGTVRGFATFTNDYPWNWGASDVEEWSTHLLENGCARSTLRNYQQLLALFMSYLVDPRYGWAEACEQRFGTHPVQICHEWNTAVHTADFEGRPETRPFTREELQGFFDHADERVALARSRGRKGWLSSFRDAALFKAMYAWGLRRTEAAKLDVTDFLSNPSAPVFGDYGKLSVRYGKASRGSAPRRRTVLTVMDWSAEVLAEYVEEIRPLYDHHDTALWPTERRERLSPGYINARFAEYRAEIGLAEELHPHCLRHAYVTHLVEDGFDSLFVQQQVGHEWASTTAIYTGVTSDYKNRVLTRALSSAFQEEPRGKEGTLTRKLGYRWHLRKLMADNDMFATTDLQPLLEKRGIKLSPAQVYRLVVQTPERLSLRTLTALCDILDCSPNDLIELVPQTETSKKSVAASTSARAQRPKPARVTKKR